MFRLLQLTPDFIKNQASVEVKYMDEKDSLKIMMYPWFAMGHLTAYLHISNKLAERGHEIFFIVPSRTQSKISHHSRHPNLIRFCPILIPHVDGLPHGTETTADVPFSKYSLLRHAMDLTRPAVESLMLELSPNFVFFDFAHWLPAVSSRLGIKSLHYCSISPAAVAFLFRDESVEALRDPPAGFPPSMIKLRTCEAHVVNTINNLKEHGSDMKYVHGMIKVNDECDAIGFRSCREMEGPYLEYLEKRFNKPVILAGPVLPEPPMAVTLDEGMRKWLDQFEPKSVIFCAFGSEARLRTDQFQELLRGFELTGFPFLAALKPPLEESSVHDALPENFLQRIGGRGIVHGYWVQQQLILSHPSVGCFVTHCGWNSLSEGLVSECALVLVPHVGDQLINARLMGGDLRVGVEVEKGDEDGAFGREGVSKAIQIAMADDSEIGKEIRANHCKWREFLLKEGLENSYIDEFVRKLHSLCSNNPKKIK
ncbi:cyanidin 3-O-galactoside 2''-O-xylosyltransferase FGGT1-like [Andrographis paniculata]|uniref:cyanidin 3-O-galactoside 2''-O-xylosyltransferase FGGT1-like n=1 Tax=Andrographis paniculata TaxID=175694 RepID=UPI0021E93AE7|nr:cyanidin 3-O-galactoside 2''-O-xylosyltransferase FGGT1-like [Andrographis paniculata]